MKSRWKEKRLMAGLMATAAIAAITGSIMTPSLAQNTRLAPTEWKYWGGDDPGATHFTPLTQITPQNVAQLKPVWIYDPGTFGRGWENTPLLIDGLLYVSDAIKGDIIALEPETGKVVWRTALNANMARVRGLTYWKGEGNMKPRIISLRGGRMYGYDLKTGQPSADWPADGVNVTLPATGGAAAPTPPPDADDPASPGPGRGGAGGGAAAGGRGAAAGGRAGGGGGGGGGGTNSSPGLIYKNYLIIQNSGSFSGVNGTPGDPRAYDLRTGQLVWRTRLLPPPGSPEAASWGGKNGVNGVGGGGWGILSLDVKTGTVYAGTDSPGPDYVGIDRPGDNKWADSTVAIDAETGKIKWAFQTHHHDVFDYDTMAAPAVAEATVNGQKIPVAIQTTKPGMMWIFDARNGKPLHGYEERPVAQSKIPNEKTSPTQPFTLGPPPLGKMSVDRDHLTTYSAESNAECKRIWDEEKLQNAGPFTPPFPTGKTVFLPGSSGAVNWGGATVNPDLGYAFTNVTNIPVMNAMNKNGNPANNEGWQSEGNFTRFADKFGRPCIEGPHGELVAVNISTGKIVWRVPLGTLEDDYGPAGKDVGATNIGPSIATKSGLLFIGATADERFRAFDARTGKKLWEYKMSASGVAGPMTYIGKDGRQYVVIAAGGPGTAAYNTNPQWGYHQTLVAFAIPRPGERIPDIVGPYPKRMPNPGERWIAQ
jgi:quinoprotein glucose dehydrogenase